MTASALGSLTCSLALPWPSGCPLGRLSKPHRRPSRFRSRTIHLRLLRKGREEPFDVSLNRAVIKISPVRARVEGDVAYVRLTTFNEQTASEMTEKLAETTGKIGNGLTGLVLDLRNNPGGLLDQAVRVADEFIDSG